MTDFVVVYIYVLIYLSTSKVINKVPVFRYILDF